MPANSPATSVKLVLVTGSGRSGTSTVAGTLKRLGFYVPQPEEPADETNPRGFYEPQWVVQFHKRLLNSVPARTNDARPDAGELVSAAASAPELRDQLRAWLAEQSTLAGAGGQLVVKDPRAFWAHELWSGAAEDLGIDLSYLTMLRHPAEVVQSRDVNYLADQTQEFRGIRQTANLAGWVNSAYQTEVASRPRPRAFVRYVDLLDDWRRTMSQVQQQLGIHYNADLSTATHHEVDDFIDAGLRRSQSDWDDVDTIPELQQQAVQAWDASNVLVDAPYDDDAVRSLAEVHERYAVLHQYAVAIALDHTNIRVEKARRAAQAKMRAKSTPPPRRRLGKRLPWKS